MIQDSGARRQFESGAVRDIAEGKGRCDLLPLDIIGEYWEDVVLAKIGEFIYDGNPLNLIVAITHASLRFFGTHDRSTVLIEVSKHYEEGAKKYADRNWEKGIPLHCFIDSAVRHYLKARRGDEDERHDRAVLWNLFGALWTMKHHPDLIDLPFAEDQK